MFRYVCSGNCIKGKISPTSGCVNCRMEPVLFSCIRCGNYGDWWSEKGLCTACEFSASVTYHTICLSCRSYSLDPMICPACNEYKAKKAITVREKTCEVCSEQFLSGQQTSLCFTCVGKAVQSIRDRYKCIKCGKTTEQPDRICESCTAREDQYYGL